MKQRNFATTPLEAVGVTTMAASAEAQETAAAAEDKGEACLGPRAPLPDIILSNKPGSWAYDTMVRQKESDV